MPDYLQGFCHLCGKALPPSLSLMSICASCILQQRSTPKSVRRPAYKQHLGSEGLKASPKIRPLDKR